MTAHDNFTDRLSRLQKEMDACTSGLLRGLHQSAIDLTNDAANTFIDLVGAVEDEAKRHRAWVDSYCAQTQNETAAVISQMEDVARRIGANPDSHTFQLLEAEKASLLVRASGLEARIFTLELNEGLRANSKPSPETLTAALFTHILGPDRKGFSLQAAKAALSFGIGLVPVLGPAADAATKVHELAKRHSIRAETADAHVLYLEEFCLSLKMWISTAHQLIEHLNASPFS